MRTIYISYSFRRIIIFVILSEMKMKDYLYRHDSKLLFCNFNYFIDDIKYLNEKEDNVISE